MKRLLIVIAACFYVLGLQAQGSVEDYVRANSIDRLYASKTYYADVRPAWIEGTTSFWYSTNTPQGKEYRLVDTKTRKKTAAFDQKELARQLAEQTGKPVDAANLPMWTIRFAPSLKEIGFDYDSSKWTFQNQGKTWLLTNAGKLEERERRYWGEDDDDRKDVVIPSPDKKYEAFRRNDNLYIRDLATKEMIQLSYDGSPGEYYSSDIQWSPDSRKIAVIKVRPVADPRYIYFVESAPEDQLQPKLHSRRYSKPGDALPYSHPHIFDVAGRKQIKPDNKLFENQYYITRMMWNKDSRAITFEYNQRGHQIYRVLEVNADNGNVRTLIEESQPKYVNYGRYYRHDLKDDKHIIWMSERDNWGHLYMMDKTAGKVKNQITKGEYYVRQVIDVDEDKQQILFSANGMTANAGEDPYFIKYYWINFDGSGLTCLTPEEGMHYAVFSPDKKYFVDSYSQVNVPPVTVLRETATGQVYMPIETADITDLKKAGWSEPIPFTAKGRDGETDMWGVIVTPSNFDPSKKYPVLEYIYAGPGSHYAPKAFSSSLRFMHNTAEVGFVVVMLDAMGTSFRSKTFEEVCWRDLKDAGFPDRIAWIKAAGEKYPWMDVERVGLFGGSAGGQNAMCGVLYHPEFYKAAYAGCGCHDNRMDKIWWNEQWMGYPVGPHYAENSNVENAWRLTRPLMLMVGEVDDNVDPASTYQVVKALQKAGKEFELVVAPSTNHTLGGPYGDRKRLDFFLKQLHGINPPDWNNVKYPKD